MDGQMMDAPLRLSALLEHAARNHGRREIVSRSVEGPIHRYTYGEAAARTKRLANALRRLGVREGDRVATLAWNTYRHFELYYAISGMGAICHTINPRLSPAQLDYIVNHAEDRLLFFDTTFTPIVAQLRPRAPSVQRFVAMTDAARVAAADSEWVVPYEQLLAGETDDFGWPALPESTAAALCYTSGTTGEPKGVLYSHRSAILHAYAAALPDSLGVRERDTILPVVPMFHVNAWGVPHVAPMTGAKLVLPGPKLDGESLCALMNAEQVTIAAGVPTIWHGLLEYLRTSGQRLETIKRLYVGGAALPASMIKSFGEEQGVEAIQGWGMTETSPIVTIGILKDDMKTLAEPQKLVLRAKQGRPLFGCEMKIISETGQELPRDGKAVGELMVRGPWIVGAYFQTPGEILKGGWFPTGDIASIDADGFMRITDRAKDLIKSGGEWISSVDLENTAMSHPDVAQAAAIAVPDAKWGERPLLVVVPRPGKSPAPEDIRAHLSGKLEKWCVPDKVVFADSLPIGATGKVLKSRLREMYAGS